MSARVFAILTVVVVQSAACGQSTPLSATERKEVVNSIAAVVQAKIKEVEEARSRVATAKINPALRAPFLPPARNALWQFPSADSRDAYLKQADDALAGVRKNFINAVPPLVAPFNTGSVGRLSKIRVYHVRDDGIVIFYVADAKGDYDLSDSIAASYLPNPDRYIPGKDYTIDGVWVAGSAIKFGKTRMNEFKPITFTISEVEKITGGR